MKQLTLITTLLFSGLLAAQSIYKSSIDSGGASVSSGGVQMYYTIGEVDVQEVTAGGVGLSEGFISARMETSIDPKIFLQGPYTTSLMADDLRVADVIPTTSPYTDGATVNMSVFNDGGTSGTGSAIDDIVDWVWIEIRDVDKTTIVYSTSALLQADGDVVDTNGISLQTVDVPFGNYYLVLNHRNHLGIRSLNTVSLLGGIMSIDLRSNSALVAGGTDGIADMGDGSYALFAGDFNENGQVQNTDRNAVIPLLGALGYDNADINMNNQVQNTDLQLLLIPNQGKGEQIGL